MGNLFSTPSSHYTVLFSVLPWSNQLPESTNLRCLRFRFSSHIQLASSFCSRLLSIESQTIQEAFHDTHFLKDFKKRLYNQYIIYAIYIYM